MATQRDYYEVLGVPKGANPDELKSAFRNLARQYHPDVSQAPDAEERFKEINEAYAVLSDADKRAAYDRYGHAGLNGFGGAPDFTNIDLTDIFEELFGFGFGMGGRGRGGGRRQNRPRRGPNLQYMLDLTFEEAVFGVEKTLEFQRDEPCSRCSGSRAEPGSSPKTCATCGGQGEVRTARQTLLGSMVQVTTCPACHGEGQTIDQPCKQCQGRGLERKHVSKTVDVPAGVDGGTQIRVSGEGQPGANGGPAGDLYIVLRVQAHKYFKRRETDILLDLDINIAQAALGAEVEVPTVDGLESLKIPAGIQPGQVLTLRGKGVPRLRSNGRGDQLVIVNVAVPKKLTADQRELLEQLAASMGSEVSPTQEGILDKLKDFLGG
ncbi:MAG: molecular chaperone DnaJ [Anaerolineae bacterium]|nr:MAG: molecular chaperone DnaJ [Anaerolineae bacterium]